MLPQEVGRAALPRGRPAGLRCQGGVKGWRQLWWVLNSCCSLVSVRGGHMAWLHIHGGACSLVMCCPSPAPSLAVPLMCS